MERIRLGGIPLNNAGQFGIFFEKHLSPDRSPDNNTPIEAKILEIKQVIFDRIDEGNAAINKIIDAFGHHTERDCDVIGMTITSVYEIFNELLSPKEASEDKGLADETPTVEYKTMSEQIPDWVIKYDKNGHQSSAGKAIRCLIEIINKHEKFLSDFDINKYVKHGENVRQAAYDKLSEEEKLATGFSLPYDFELISLGFESGVKAILDKLKITPPTPPQEKDKQDPVGELEKLFDEGSMLVRDWDNHEQFLMNKGAFVEIVSTLTQRLTR